MRIQKKRMSFAVFSFVVWFLSGLVFWGCGGGDGGGSIPEGSFFSCQLDGAAFPVGYAGVAVRGAEKVIFATTGNEVSWIWIQFDPPTTLPATIPLGTPAHNWAHYWADYRNPGTQYLTTSPPASGTLTITALTEARCAGTFSFTGRNSTGAQVTLTNGSFDIPALPLPQ